jgi:hypothetical protein
MCLQRNSYRHNQHALYTTTDACLTSSYTTSTTTTPAYLSSIAAAILPGNTNKPQAFHDVYIDDFITIAYCPTHLHTFNKLLHALDLVFQDSQGSPRCSIISTSKLEKVEATFVTSKIILWRDIDMYKMMLSLPESQLTAMTLS